VVVRSGFEVSERRSVSSNVSGAQYKHTLLDKARVHRLLRLLLAAFESNSALVDRRTFRYFSDSEEDRELLMDLSFKCYFLGSKSSMLLVAVPF
jgi:hypothetical protein